MIKCDASRKIPGPRVARYRGPHIPSRARDARANSTGGARTSRSCSGTCSPRPGETTRAVERFFERREEGPGVARIDPQVIEALLRHRFTLHTRELERLIWTSL